MFIFHLVNTCVGPLFTTLIYLPSIQITTVLFSYFLQIHLNVDDRNNVPFFVSRPLHVGALSSLMLCCLPLNICI